MTPVEEPSQSEAFSPKTGTPFLRKAVSCVCSYRSRCFPNFPKPFLSRMITVLGDDGIKQRPGTLLIPLPVSLVGASCLPHVAPIFVIGRFRTHCNFAYCNACVDWSFKRLKLRRRLLLVYYLCAKPIFLCAFGPSPTTTCMYASTLFVFSRAPPTTPPRCFVGGDF